MKFCIGKNGKCGARITSEESEKCSRCSNETTLEQPITLEKNTQEKIKPEPLNDTISVTEEIVKSSEKAQTISSSQPTKTIQITIAKNKITDTKLIEKYNGLYKSFFVPSFEDDTYDKELLAENTYHKTAEQIGQYLPIAVAIWEDDPNKSQDTMFRVHLRIIDGRHRYFTSNLNFEKWKTEFYKVNSFEEFMLLRSIFDSKKKENVTEKSKFFIELAKYYFDVKGLAKNQISAAIQRDFPNMERRLVQLYLPLEYKNPMKVLQGSSSHDNVPSLDKLRKIDPQHIQNFITRKNKQIVQLKINVLSLSDEVEKTRKPEFEIVYDILSEFIKAGEKRLHITDLEEPLKMTQTAMFDFCEKMAKVDLISRPSGGHFLNRQHSTRDYWMITEKGKHLHEQILSFKKLLDTYKIKIGLTDLIDKNKFKIQPNVTEHTLRPNPLCPECKSDNVVKAGNHKVGDKIVATKYYCKKCKNRFKRGIDDRLYEYKFTVVIATAKVIGKWKTLGTNFCYYESCKNRNGFNVGDKVATRTIATNQFKHYHKKCAEILGLDLTGLSFVKDKKGRRMRKRNQ